MKRWNWIVAFNYTLGVAVGIGGVLLLHRVWWEQLGSALIFALFLAYLWRER